MVSRSLQRQVSRLRSHDTTRAEIARAAIRSFLRNGFEHTTVDDIAAAAGISRRTYFRYFASKDESLLSDMQEMGISVAEAFRRAPASLPPLTAMREAFLEIEGVASEFPERQRSLGAMLRANQRVHGALLLVQLEWIEEFAEVIANRRGDSVERPTDRLIAHMGMDAWNMAVDWWLEDEGSSLHDQAARAFELLGQLVPNGGDISGS